MNNAKISNYSKKFANRRSSIALLLLMAMVTQAPVAHAVLSGYSTATWSPLPNRSSSSGLGKGGWHYVKAKPGETVTAEFTNNGNVIKNINGQTPKKSRTTANGKKGVKIFVPGSVNGRTVNDKHVTKLKLNGTTVTLDVAFFNVDGPAPFGNWLDDNGYAGDSFFTLPDFDASGTSFFYGVDGVIWDQLGFDVTESMYGTSYMVINGVTADLPGIVFSMTSLENTGSAWVTANPYTGLVTLDSMHMMQVPAPGSLALLGLGGLIATRRRRA